MIHLVRHARAANRGSWASDDALRPLTADGRRQATALRELLGDVKFDRIVSSPSLRCLETVLPIAAQRLLPIEPHPALHEGSSLDGVFGLLRESAWQTSLLCTHGDVIGDLLGHLAARTDIELGPTPQLEKGSTWVLHTNDDGHITAANYLPAP